MLVACSNAPSVSPTNQNTSSESNNIAVSSLESSCDNDGGTIDSSQNEHTHSNEENSSSDNQTSSAENTSSQDNTPVYYHVVFTNDDDSILYETDILEGNQAHYEGETPIKNDDDEYTYTFIGWDKDLTSISSNLTTKAVYEQTAIGWSSIHFDYI